MNLYINRSLSKHKKTTSSAKHVLKYFVKEKYIMSRSNRKNIRQTTKIAQRQNNSSSTKKLAYIVRHLISTLKRIFWITKKKLKCCLKYDTHRRKLWYKMEHIM